MAAADHHGPVPDLYQLPGVARDASREQIARAWRRRARTEHPDARPGQPGGEADEAGARFRALAGAWQVPGGPGRRIRAAKASWRREQRRRPPGARCGRSVQRAQERLPDPGDLGRLPGGIGRVVRVVKGAEAPGHRRGRGGRAGHQETSNST